MDRRVVLLGLLLAAMPASGQIPDTRKVITAPDGSLDAAVVPAADTTGALQVKCVDATCAGVGGPTDTDDGTITGTQTAGLQIGLNYIWNGLTWQRMIAAALADATANPTVASFGSFPHVWNGITWDRWTGTVTTQVQPGVDIGDVTVNNAAGAAAVNIQDGGNSLTVDGTVAANQGTPASTANRWPVQITDGTDLAIVTAGGSLQMECVGGCGVSTFGFAFPINGLAAGFTDGTNLQPGQVTTTDPFFGASGLIVRIAQNAQALNTQTTVISLPNEGQQTMANSISVAVASNQSAVPVSATDLDIRNLTATDIVTVTDGAGALNVICDSGCGSPSQAMTYFAVSTRVASTAAVKDYLNLFNAAGSGKVLRIVAIRVSSDNTAAITGLGWTAELNVTSTVGATCTATTIRLADSTNTAVPAQVTASHTCTTDPTVTFQFGACQYNVDEAAVLQGPDLCYAFANNGGQPLTLREGQGLMLRTSNAVAPVGLVTVTVEFTM